MGLTINASFLPHLEPDASVSFYCDLLGFEVRLDVGGGAMRWITIGLPGQTDTNLVLQPPACDPGLSEQERQTIDDMMAKGTYAAINLAADDIDALFETLHAAGAEIVQAPTDRPYGKREGAVRDPAGNLVRIQAALPA